MAPIVADTTAEVIALVGRTTRASGVPIRVDDSATVEYVAEILRGGDDDSAA
jgi:hypothetical protein